MQAASAANHETVNTSSIEYLQRIFNSADQNGGGDLDEDEFIAALSACKLSTADGSDEVRALRRLCQLPIEFVALQPCIAACPQR